MKIVLSEEDKELLRRILRSRVAQDWAWWGDYLEKTQPEEPCPTLPTKY